MAPVHIAITRQVKPGKEEEFERELREFARDSLHEPGTTGIHLIEPVPGSDGCEYGILRSFADEAASEAFYTSDRFTDWQRRVGPLVLGEPIRRRLHGLEAFFRETKMSPPPRWKMAIVTWLGVFPTVLLWSSALSRLQNDVPHIFVMAVINVFVVITLTWGVMPLLTRLFAGWLHKERLK